MEIAPSRCSRKAATRLFACIDARCHREMRLTVWASFSPPAVGNVVSIQNTPIKLPALGTCGGPAAMLNPYCWALGLSAWS